MPQQGTKLKVGDPIPQDVQIGAPIPPDASIGGPGSSAVTPRPEASQPGAMQRTPGGTIFTPRDIERGVIDKALQNKDYETIRRVKEGEFAQDFPKTAGVDPRAPTAEGWRYAGIGIRPDVAARIALQSGIGTVAGGTVGKYLMGERGKYIGAGLGGLYGGIRGGMEQPAVPGGLSKLLSLSRWGNAIKSLLKEEPNQVAGTAREMAGGTAATAMPGAAAETGAGTIGGQAGPSAGPKNSGELSAVVQRTRSGTAPGMAGMIVTPQQAAQESQQFTQNAAQARAQGMANAARNPEAPGSATAIPGRFTSPEYTPRPSTPTVASTTEQGFSGLGKMMPGEGTAAARGDMPPAQPSVSQPALVEQMRNAVLSGSQEERTMALQRLREMGINPFERFRQ